MILRTPIETASMLHRCCSGDIDAPSMSVSVRLPTRTLVDGRTNLGLMSSGQVTGLIDDLPSWAELIEGIMTEAGRCLDRLDEARKA